MKLHLHLGAHKTATTHFQTVLLNRGLYLDKSHYVPMEEFRENVTRDLLLFDRDSQGDVSGYLEQLERIETSNLIISDENIIGLSGDIYDSNRLYCKLENRIGRLKDFVSRFSDANIWISVRSMDGFIPSLYCESLLHQRFRRFSSVLSGQYEQSWLPIVLALKDNFPLAKINVIPYETYGEILPYWLELITGIRGEWDLLEKERPRESMNSLSLKIMNAAHPFIPPAKLSAVSETMSWYFYKKGWGSKFSPFNEPMKSSLRSLYISDLERIERLGGNVRLVRI